jgi:hypothetical protein
MAGRTIQYAELNASELAKLDPARTIVLMALSPLEVHVDEALAQLERAMRGEPPYSRPLLWSMRWVERS